MWHVDDIIRAVKGVPFKVERDKFTGISTDSRTVKEGEIFVPLSGKNFDGHKFIGPSYDKSHGGCLCEKKREDVLKDIAGTIILVDDAMQALLDLAQYKRKRIGSKVIAITGSNGKTTTKEILVNIVKRGFSVHYNEKNYNNLIGVSKSILSIHGEPDVCIFELGTNSKGEIKLLAQLTEPDVSLITNINPSHLEGLFDLEGILEEKLSLFYHTREGGRVIINADDPYILPRYKDVQHVSRTYGMVHNADFTLFIEEDLGWQGLSVILKLSGNEVRARTTLLGKHNLYNILAAAAIAYSIGAEGEIITAGIETFDSYTMRFKPVQSKTGYIVIDDTYNANPSSMEWAIKTLLALPCNGKRVVILGDMKELGEKTSYYHRELGRFLRETGIPVIALIGEYVSETFQELKGDRVKLFESKGPLIDYVAKNVEKGDVVLVKGSRAAKMEEIVEALT